MRLGSLRDVRRDALASYRSTVGDLAVYRILYASIILLSQVLNGLLLPVILVYMTILVNREDLMGTFRNGPVANAVTWATTVVLVALAGMMVVTSFLPGGSGGF